VPFASHAVGNDPQIYFLSHSESVFIVLSHPAYVGLASDVNAELAAVVHANSLGSILYSVPVVPHVGNGHLASVLCVDGHMLGLNDSPSQDTFSV
jgi:hypothetical protein